MARFRTIGLDYSTDTVSEFHAEAHIDYYRTLAGKRRNVQKILGWLTWCVCVSKKSG